VWEKRATPSLPVLDVPCYTCRQRLEPAARLAQWGAAGGAPRRHSVRAASADLVATKHARHAVFWKPSRSRSHSAPDCSRATRRPQPCPHAAVESLAEQQRAGAGGASAGSTLTNNCLWAHQSLRDRPRRADPVSMSHSPDLQREPCPDRIVDGARAPLKDSACRCRRYC
jgi:hypothetical protein